MKWTYENINITYINLKTKDITLLQNVYKNINESSQILRVNIVLWFENVNKHWDIYKCVITSVSDYFLTKQTFNYLCLFTSALKRQKEKLKWHCEIRSGFRFRLYSLNLAFKKKHIHLLWFISQSIMFKYYNLNFRAGFYFNAENISGIIFSLISWNKLS